MEITHYHMAGVRFACAFTDALEAATRKKLQINFVSANTEQLIFITGPYNISLKLGQQKGFRLRVEGAGLKPFEFPFEHCPNPLDPGTQHRIPDAVTIIMRACEHIFTP